jgi:DNA-directed RNA polymerase subunit RPC12/RpoP
MATRCICPHCRKIFVVDHIEKMVGTKIRCANCNGKILIQAPPVRKSAATKAPPLKTAKAQAAPVKSAPGKKKKKPDSEIIELDEDAIVVDDDSDVDDFAIADVDYGTEDYAEAELVEDEPAPNRRLMVARKAKPKKSEGFQEAAGNEQQPRRAQKKSNGFYLALAAGVVVLCTLGVVVVVLVSSAGLLGGGKFQEPSEYVDFSPRDLQLSASIPKGWEKTYGGGQQGVPIHATFKSGKISIEVRESIGGGAMGAAGLAMQQKFGGDEADAVEGIHESHRARISEDFGSYKEDASSRTIKTAGFGPGKVSDFDADSGFLGGGHVRGCRATVLNQLHQFDVICKCPAGMFEDVRPVFEKVIMSLGG